MLRVASRMGFGDLDVRRLAGLLVIAVAVGLLWSHPVLKPVKLFVVFLHEGSHALVAAATGGKIVDIRLLFSEGGATRTVGGSRFWTLTAGYVGSLLSGGLILILATRTRATRTLAVAIGVGVGLATVAYVRNAAGFGFGVAFAAGMIAAGILLRVGLVRWLLCGLGLTSCFYAIYDIVSDVLLRPEAPSDARMLAELTSFPPLLSMRNQTLFWGVLWMAICLVATFWILATSAGRVQRDSRPADPPPT